MQNHTKVYLNFFNFHNPDFIHCEVCQSKAVDIHHITPRSKFGSKEKEKQDEIENLIALCRKCHDLAHAEKYSKEFLRKVHEKNLKVFK